MISLVEKKLEVDADVVGVCKKLLALAEAGEIRAVFVAVDMADGSSGRLQAVSDAWNPANLVLAFRLMERTVLDQCTEE